jgi:hypothetical protein
MITAPIIPELPPIPWNSLPPIFIIYAYSPDGRKLDSVFVPGTDLYKPETTTWFSNIVRFELGRYITPYGIGLDLGPDGKTWYYDVTDYAPLLHDFVYLQSGNNQELHNLRFLMIKGEPARDVKRIQNVYDGNWSFASIVSGANAPERMLTLDPEASAYRIKTRTTGPRLCRCGWHQLCRIL